MFLFLFLFISSAAVADPISSQLEKITNNKMDEYIYDYEDIQAAKQEQLVQQETQSNKTAEQTTQQETQKAEGPSFLSKLKKSFLDYQSNLPKPIDINGKYYGVRLNLAFGTKLDFTAAEKILGSNAAEQVIFRGAAQYNYIPSLSIMVGDTAYSFYRYELELMYTDLKAHSIATTQMLSGSNFDVQKNALSYSILSLYANNFIEFNPIIDSLRVFIGLGIGAGYVITNTSALSNSFFFPAFQGMIGANFMVTQKTKMGIFFRSQFYDLSIGQKNPFVDSNQVLQNNRPIGSGGLEMKNILLHSIGVELFFY